MHRDVNTCLVDFTNDSAFPVVLFLNSFLGTERTVHAYYYVACVRTREVGETLVLLAHCYWRHGLLYSNKSSKNVLIFII